MVDNPTPAEEVTPAAPVVERYGPLSILPVSPTPEQREIVRASDLYKLGDARLAWVNEGDLSCLLLSTPSRGGEVEKLREALASLVAKVASPNGWDWMFPLRVIAVDGKPTIKSHKGGNLFRGYIGTWDEADLLVALANAAPQILAALAFPSPAEADTPAASEGAVPAGESFLAQLRRVNTDRYHAWVGDGQDAGILFDAAELGGEVGELLNVVKKLEREERGWRGSRAAPQDFADECADVLICLDKLARRRGVDLEAATVAKFNATSDKQGFPHMLAAAPKLASDTGTRVEAGEGQGFYDAVKRYSYPAGTEVVVRIHETGWDVYDPVICPPSSFATATGGVRDHAGSVREVDTIKIRLSPTSDEVHSLGRVVRWERASDPAAITPTEVSALRYLLNWSDTPRKQVGSILKTFTLDGEERTYTKDALESLWRKLSAALHPVDSRAQGGEKA